MSGSSLVPQDHHKMCRFSLNASGCYLKVWVGINHKLFFLVKHQNKPALAETNERGEGLRRPELHEVLSPVARHVRTHASLSVCASPGPALSTDHSARSRHHHRVLKSAEWQRVIKSADCAQCSPHGQLDGECSGPVDIVTTCSSRVSTEGSLVTWGSTFPVEWRCTPCSQAASTKHNDTSSAQTTGKAAGN